MGPPPKPSVSGFGGERRSKEAGKVFAVLGRKRSQADFATTRLQGCALGGNRGRSPRIKEGGIPMLKVATLALSLIHI